jgi:hypothetical protein
LKYFGGCRTQRYYGYPPLDITDDKGTVITTVIELRKKKKKKRQDGQEQLVI